MDKKEYQIGAVTVYQSELNIKQAKLLSKLFIEKNILGGEFNFEVLPGELAASILETDSVTEFMNIVLRNKQGGELEEIIDGDELQLNFLTEVCRDFFTFNPSLAMLFGTSCVQAALMRAKTSLTATTNSSNTASLSSSEKISEEEMNLNTGTNLTSVTEDLSSLKVNTAADSTDSQEEEEVIIKVPNL